jgi:hypothetical protein
MVKNAFRLSIDFRDSESLLDFVETFEETSDRNVKFRAYKVDDLDKDAQHHFLLKREGYKEYGKLVRKGE